MTFSEIAGSIGIPEYPAAMENYYDPLNKTPACNLMLVDDLQKKYNMFGDYYALVKEYGEKLNRDENRSAWVKTAVAYCKAVDFYAAKAVPAPGFDGTLLTNMLPLYILVAQIPDSLAAYRSRGFPEEELEKHYKVYRESIAFVEDHTGLPGIDSRYYAWSTHFIKAQIFEVCGLQFEMRRAPKQAVYLREKETGRVIPVMYSGTFHKSGIQTLGSAGYTDPEGAFSCTFREDAEYFYGHGCFDFAVSPQEQRFSKREWECVLRPGDPCLGMHIPAGADISVETVKRSIAAARELVKQRFPEFAGRLVFCSSWLLDPQLSWLLGERSNISAFQNCYIRFPQLSPGTSVFGFVFPKRYGSLEQLPEDSSLRRKLKKLYLDGGYIYGYAGVIF